MSKVWFVLAQFIHSTHEKLVVYNGPKTFWNG